MVGERTVKLGNANGFTLIEVILAIAIGATILTLATTSIFGMAELWGAGANERLFKKHARGVSRFLEHSFQVVGARYSDEEEASSVYWHNWEGDRKQKEEYLTFELEKSPGALVWPSSPLPHVVCSLHFEEGEGLYLLWKSRLEEGFEKDEPRKTLISPFVTEVRYHYIDFEAEFPEWEISSEPKRERDQSYILPQRIELIFLFKGERISRQLVIPSAMGGVPLF